VNVKMFQEERDGGMVERKLSVIELCLFEHFACCTVILFSLLSPLLLFFNFWK